MLLEVYERLALLDLLPKEGDYAAIKTTRRAREMIGFTTDEQETLKFVRNEVDKTLRWDTEKNEAMVRDIPVDEWTTNTIRQALINMSNDKKLNDQYFSLYEKFVANFE